MKVKKIMSGMLAGVVAVSYSMVYQLPAAAVDTEVCKNFKLSAFGATGFNLAACGVIINESTVTVTCTLPGDLTVQNEETGEYEPVENAFSAVLNNDWNNNKIDCKYVYVYFDGLFLDDSNDSTVIKEIGIQLGSNTTWSEERNSSICVSDKLPCIPFSDSRRSKDHA